MPFTTNFQGPAIGKKQREAVVEALTTVFANRPGKWHVQFISHGEDTEVRVSGPGVETSDYVGSVVDPQAVAAAVERAVTG